MSGNGLPDEAVWRRQAGETLAAPERLETPIPELIADRGGAVLGQGGSRSYAQLRHTARNLAWLIATLVPPGRCVAVLAQHGPDWPGIYLAALTAGRTIVLLSAALPTERIAAILAQSGACFAVIDTAATARRLPAGITIIDAGAAGDVPGTDWPAPLPLDAPALVIATSGSSGTPKGIVRSRRQVLLRALRQVDTLGLAADDRVMILGQATAGTGVSQTLAALLAGAGLCLQPPAAGLVPVLRLAESARASVLFAMPSLLRSLLALPGAARAFAGLRHVYLTSEGLTGADHAAWRPMLPADCAVVSVYGLTEASPLAVFEIPRDLPAAAATVPLGVPMPGLRWAILDEARRPVADGAEGELWVRSPHLSLGEWRDGACVAGRLLATADGSAMLRTGDLMRRGADGLLHGAGRIDAQVKINGNRVEPAEIEAVLRRVPGVAEAVVVTGGGPGRPRVVALVVARDAEAGATLRQDVLAALRAALPGWLQPTELRVVGAIPRLVSGKPDAPAILAAGA